MRTRSEPVEEAASRAVRELIATFPEGLQDQARKLVLMAGKATILAVREETEDSFKEMLKAVDKQVGALDGQ